MSEHTPTLLIVYLYPGNDEGARFHLDETLTMAAIAYHLIAELEERVALEGCAPFVVMHPEKRLVFALHAPLDPKTIGDIAQLVITGLIFTQNTQGYPPRQVESLPRRYCRL